MKNSIGNQTKDMRDIAEKVAIGTTTFYREGDLNGRTRANLATITIKTAVDSGYRIIVVDGSPDDWFRKSIENCGAEIHLETQNGMGPSRREALQYAHDSKRPIISWMEPEKLDYVKEIWKTAKPILNGKAEMVIGNRGNLKDYPTSQQHTEHYGNTIWRELTGLDLDMWSGMRTWKRELSDFFLDYQGEYGDKWDSIFIPVMDAVFDGKKVVGVKVNYKHSIEQTTAEEGNALYSAKRLVQLDNLVPALQDRWAKLNLRQI